MMPYTVSWTFASSPETLIRSAYDIQLSHYDEFGKMGMNEYYLLRNNTTQAVADENDGSSHLLDGTSVA